MRLIDADELKDRTSYIEDEYGHLFDTIDEMPTIGAWIPCSERLPKDNAKVIAQDEFGNIIMNIYDKKWYHNYAKMVAWQPLPESYKE